MEEYDVIIVGAGPAGLVFANHMARWGHKYLHIDNRPGPTISGRADSIQPRTLDLLRELKLKDKLYDQGAVAVPEISSWAWNEKEQDIKRVLVQPVVPDQIECRDRVMTMITQPFVENAFIEDNESRGYGVLRPWKPTKVEVSEKEKFPVQLAIQSLAKEETKTVKARYLFDAEGGKSSIREMQGLEMNYMDPPKHVWAAMDGRLKTDFPDIHKLNSIHAEKGSCLVLPHEDGKVRLYTKITTKGDADYEELQKPNEEQTRSRQKEVFHPYKIEWETVEWFSAFPIGQGLIDTYSKDKRVFYGGDVCHTHGPTHGQGMNTAFFDASNLAWKMHHVLSGFASPKLLDTYESERKSVGKHLLHFDNVYAEEFSLKISGPDDPDFKKYIETRDNITDFSLGYGAEYGDNAINRFYSATESQVRSLTHPDGGTNGHKKRKLAHDNSSVYIRIGHPLPHADVTRVSDSTTAALEAEIPVNGAWRVYIFAGTTHDEKDELHKFSESFSKSALAQKIGSRDDNSQGGKNPFMSFCTIFASEKANFDLGKAMPPYLLQLDRSRVYLDNIKDNRRPQEKAPVHAKMGVPDLKKGAIILARPDGWVAMRLEIEGSDTVKHLEEYFEKLSSDADLTKPY